MSAHVRQFQREWNAFSDRFHLHYHHLAADGVAGHKTKVAIKKSRYYLGVGSRKYGRNSTAVTPELLATLSDPFRRVRGYTRARNLLRRRTAATRRKARIKRWEALKPQVHGGVGVFDGRPVGSLAIPFLKKARDKRWWSGILVSGYRTPEHSRDLCRAMCGHDTCPGRCAGMFTNHAKLVWPGPAKDVSDYIRYAWAMVQLGSVFRNNLPADRVHFSQNGS